MGSQIRLWTVRICGIAIFLIHPISPIPRGPVIISVAWWAPPLRIFFINKGPVEGSAPPKCRSQNCLNFNIIFTELETPWTINERAHIIFLPLWGRGGNNQGSTSACKSILTEKNLMFLSDSCEYKHQGTGDGNCKYESYIFSSSLTIFSTVYISSEDN